MGAVNVMFSAQSAKAFVASILAALASASVAAPEGFTTAEVLTILGAMVVTFQGTYWTTNAKGEPDGTIDVAEIEGKKTFLLNLNSDPAELDTKEEVVFKINK